jgi:hypothetical protein
MPRLTRNGRRALDSRSSKNFHTDSDQKYCFPLSIICGSNLTPMGPWCLGWTPGAAKRVSGRDFILSLPSPASFPLSVGSLSYNSAPAPPHLWDTQHSSRFHSPGFQVSGIRGRNNNPMNRPGADYVQIRPMARPELIIIILLVMTPMILFQERVLTGFYVLFLSVFLWACRQKARLDKARRREEGVDMDEEFRRRAGTLTSAMAPGG